VTLEQWLGVLGLVVGVSGLGLAYYFYRKTIRTKVLAISYTDPIPVRLHGDGSTKVPAVDEQQGYWSRSFVLLWNRGASPIEASDFAIPILIKEKNNIMSATVFDKDMAAKVSIENENAEMTVHLIRPTEAVIIQIDSSSKAYRPSLDVQMKSSDMSVPANFELFLELRYLTAGFTVFFVFILITIILSAVGAYQPPRLSSGVQWPAVFSNGALLLASFLISALIVRPVLILTDKFLGSRTPSIVRRFGKMQQACSSIHNDWKSITQQMQDLTTP